MHFGHARVSTKDQHLDTQLDQLKAAGVDRLFQEKISGTTTQRPVLTELLATQVLGSLVMPHSRGGFVLQVGYFQATGRFFSTDQFKAADGAYVQ